MDEFTFIVWMNSLDPLKVRREESFQSDNHRKMMAEHELTVMFYQSESHRTFDGKMNDLAALWRDREFAERAEAQRKKAEAEELRMKRAVRKVQFTEQQLAIAKDVFG